jgi:hypothetical protein
MLIHYHKLSCHGCADLFTLQSIGDYRAITALGSFAFEQGAHPTDPFVEWSRRCFGLCNARLPDLIHFRFLMGCFAFRSNHLLFVWSRRSSPRLLGVSDAHSLTRWVTEAADSGDVSADVRQIRSQRNCNRENIEKPSIFAVGLLRDYHHHGARKAVHMYLAIAPSSSTTVAAQTTPATRA